MPGSSTSPRWMVMAHELGHVIGGKHEDSLLAGCAAAVGVGSSICGASIVVAGPDASVGARRPYFSDATDANLAAAIGPLLPEWP